MDNRAVGVGEMWEIVEIDYDEAYRSVVHFLLIKSNYLWLAPHPFGVRKEMNLSTASTYLYSATLDLA
jgi:hypothetical protein